ncbi:tRNA(m5U54)methyltransferase [Coemansia sp. RSA 988]|nr:tRNA(m5U54)methyltransferase [Coemansia sp. RSA 988]
MSEDATTSIGAKRAISPANPAAAEALAAGATQKRMRAQTARSRKPRQARKAAADHSVLDAVELLLKEVWLSGRTSSSTAELPTSFGWPAGDQQSETLFCRNPPVPAKLAGGEPAECELEVYIHELSERGMGIATRESPGELCELVTRGGRPWIFAVPFTLSGERARVRSVRHEWGYTQTDLLGISEQSPLRVEAPCKYYGECSGCQLQHIGYEDQLRFKHQVVQRAFAHANPLFERLTVSPVIQSPLQLGYRTKLTPHFDVNKHSQLPEQVPIGFTRSGQRRVLDIEDCIIGTDAVRRGLADAREDARSRMSTFKRGATLLVRETNVATGEDVDIATVPTFKLKKDYTLDPKSWVTDVVGDLKFRYPASSFFQNNASILPAFTGYVRDELSRWGRVLYASDGSSNGLQTLIDAYCGSGLFGIACHKGFESVLGIEISNESISCADYNAKMNGVFNAKFLLGDASKIFDKVGASADRTAVIIDPPRKGSNPDFLDQLIAYGPRVIIYIACGVPAQARDIQHMYTRGAITIDGQTTNIEAKSEAVYRIEGVQPFDLFPQTFHVENIITLVREG